MICNRHRAANLACRVAGSCATGTTGIVPVASYTYASSGDLLATHTYTNATDYTTETYAYDMLGNRIATTDAHGNTIFRTYDPLGHVVAEWGATYPVRYTYDTQGRRTSLSTTRDGTTWDTTTWTYDPATGNCLSKTYADGSTITYTHTSDELLLRETKPSGAWKENVYDAARQIVGVFSSDGAQDASMQRDEFGRVTTESNFVARTEYYLDDYWGATNEVQTVDGVSVSFEREFDAYGRLVRLARVGGEGAVFGYAPHGAISAVSNGDVAVEYTFTGDALDAGYALVVQGGVAFLREVLHHDYLRNCIVAVSNHCGNASQGLEYSYDALRRPISRNSDSFGYNVRGEVTSATIDGRNESHSYDDIGNSIQAVYHEIAYTCTANARNQYSSIAAVAGGTQLVASVSYDLDGNMTRHGEWTYVYDSGNRLVSVSSNGTTIATMYYDAQGRRVEKIASDGTHRYFYDGWLLVYEHITHSDNTISEVEYIWGKDVSCTRDGAAGIGGLLYQKRDGAIYVPWYDAYGNILGYRDAQGNVVASYTYDAFGNIIGQSGTMADTFSFRFSTKYFDADCDLYYYGYRHYKPQIMCWLTEDPAGLNGGMNTYMFCSNAAMYKSDIDGRWEWFWIPDWTEERARQEVSAKIQEMRENGYDFAADALGHYLRNTAQNIDLSRYSNEISRHHEWRKSFLSSVLKQLKTRDPRGTDKKVEIGDVAHKASFNADLQNGNILDMFTTQFSHRFYPTESMGLFYALYGSYYSYVGTASWCRRNKSTMFMEDERTSIEIDLQVASYDMLSYGGGFPRTTFPSYSAAQYLQKNHNYNTPFIYLRWTEKGAWEISDWHTLYSNGIQCRKLK